MKADIYTIFTIIFQWQLRHEPKIESSSNKKRHKIVTIILTGHWGLKLQVKYVIFQNYHGKL